MIRDKGTEFMEDQARADRDERDAELYWRHAPRDFPPPPAPDGPPAAPWRVLDERTLYGGRPCYVVVSDDDRTVAFVEDLDAARIAGASTDMLDALETLFDGHGLVTGPRLARGMAKARLAMARARLGFP